MLAAALQREEQWWLMLLRLLLLMGLAFVWPPFVVLGRQTLGAQAR